jgi:fucose permease
MGAYAVMNIMLASIGVLRPGWVGLWAIFLTSLFMSLMFPTIFALGLKGLGPNTQDRWLPARDGDHRRSCADAGYGVDL